MQILSHLLIISHENYSATENNNNKRLIKFAEITKKFSGFEND